MKTILFILLALATVSNAVVIPSGYVSLGPSPDSPNYEAFLQNVYTRNFSSPGNPDPAAYINTASVEVKDIMSSQTFNIWQGMVDNPSYPSEFGQMLYFVWDLKAYNGETFSVSNVTTNISLPWGPQIDFSYTDYGPLAIGLTLDGSTILSTNGQIGDTLFERVRVINPWGVIADIFSGTTNQDKVNNAISSTNGQLNGTWINTSATVLYDDNGNPAGSQNSMDTYLGPSSLVVPEPSSVVLLLTATLSMCFCRRRK